MAKHRSGGICKSYEDFSNLRDLNYAALTGRTTLEQAAKLGLHVAKSGDYLARGDMNPGFGPEMGMDLRQDGPNPSNRPGPSMPFSKPRPGF